MRPPLDLTPWNPQLPTGLVLDVAAVQDHMADIPLAEQALVIAAVRSRREEFSSARHLAHRLLEKQGEAMHPILTDLDRSPLWPKGWLGSLSHGRKWCAAVLARSGGGLKGVGIDLEEIRPIREDLYAEILTESEMQEMRRSKAPATHAAHVLSCFSIKEAVYKAMHPIGNHGLGFQAMQIRRLESTGKVHMQALEELQERLQGHALPEVLHLRQNDVILSLAWLGSDVMPHS